MVYLAQAADAFQCPAGRERSDLSDTASERLHTIPQSAPYSRPVTASHCRSRSISTARIPLGRGASTSSLSTEPGVDAGPAGASGRWIRSWRDGRALARYRHSIPPASVHLLHGWPPSHFVRRTRHASHAFAMRLGALDEPAWPRSAGIEPVKLGRVLSCAGRREESMHPGRAGSESTARDSVAWVGRAGLRNSDGSYFLRRPTRCKLHV